MGASSRRVFIEPFRLTLDLYEAGERIMRQNLRRRFPDSSETEIESRLAAWLRGDPEHKDPHLKEQPDG